MKTVYRQDGSEAVVDDETATTWLRLGLATEKKVVVAVDASLTMARKQQAIKPNDK